MEGERSPSSNTNMAQGSWKRGFWAGWSKPGGRNKLQRAEKIGKKINRKGAGGRICKLF